MINTLDNPFNTNQVSCSNREIIVNLLIICKQLAPPRSIKQIRIMTDMKASLTSKSITAQKEELNSDRV